jgi:rod shape-determining protein MreC
MTPRRWFWALVLSTALVLVVNQKFLIPVDYRNGGGGGGPVAALHGWVRDNLVGTLLMPAAATLRWGQQKFERLGVSLRGGPEGPGELGSVDAQRLRDENMLLKNQTIWLSGRVDALEGALRELHQLENFPSLMEQKLVRANVRGFGSGQAGQTVTLDRGTADGLRPGAIVIAQLAPIGRVISAGTRVSTVRLLTDQDRSMRVTARILRPGASGFTPIATGCQVRGAGDGMLRCDSIDATQGIPPDKGDIVQLEDNDWALLRGATIGEVLQVSRLENQHLRYDLLIRPAVAIGDDTVVWVVTSK